MFPKIDNKFFQDGREAFNRGVSLRDIVEHVNKLKTDATPLSAPDNESEGEPAWKRAEREAASVILGYADAFVEVIRRMNPEKRGGGQRA